MKKTCPRCGAGFDCKEFEDVSRCQCAGIELSAEARAYIEARYPKQCLCAACLKALSERYPERF